MYRLVKTAGFGVQIHPIISRDKQMLGMTMTTVKLWCMFEFVLQIQNLFWC